MEYGTESARPIGGPTGPREEYRPEPHRFRRDQEYFTKSKEGDMNATDGETMMESVRDAIKPGDQTVTDIQAATGLDRKRIRDTIGRLIKKGDVVDSSRPGLIASERVFSCVRHLDNDSISEAVEPKIEELLADSERFTAVSGFCLPDQQPVDLHDRLEHLYKTAQASLGAFWEAVVELKDLADDALMAKEQLQKVYDVLGTGPHNAP